MSIRTLNAQEGLCRYQVLSLPLYSVLRTLASLASLDAQLHLLTPEDSAELHLDSPPLPQPGNSLKAVKCGNHRITSFVSCPSGIPVLHCLMSRILKYTISCILPVFFPVVSVSRVNRQTHYSILNRKRSLL